jgi:hypothetical protein
MLLRELPPNPAAPIVVYSSIEAMYMHGRRRSTS